MAKLPLYDNAREVHENSGRLPDTAHAGLWFDKFVNTWKDQDWGKGLAVYSDRDGRENITKDPKKDWLEQFCARPLGHGERIREMARRQEGLARAMGGSVFKVRTASPFVTGMGRNHPVENGFAWHSTLGTPYLPGSGVKGVARSWAVEWAEGFDDQAVERIFGPRDSKEHTVGSVIFLDMLPEGKIQMKLEVMTPHYGAYYQDGEVPGDWLSPTPVPFLAVDAGQEFQLAICPRRPGNDDDMAGAKLVGEHVNDMLAFMGCGAKTSSGFGRMEKNPGKTGDFMVWIAKMIVLDQGGTPLRLAGNVTPKDLNKKIKNKLKGIEDDNQYNDTLECMKGLIEPLINNKTKPLKSLLNLDPKPQS